MSMAENEMPASAASRRSFSRTSCSQANGMCAIASQALPFGPSGSDHCGHLRVDEVGHAGRVLHQDLDLDDPRIGERAGVDRKLAVLGHLRSDLVDDPLNLPRQGVARDRRALADLELEDVGLGHLSDDVHPIRVYYLDDALSADLLP